MSNDDWMNTKTIIKKASKYCARLRPLKLVYKSLAYENKSDASKEEYRIKQLYHKDKLKIIKKFMNELAETLERYIWVFFF